MCGDVNVDLYKCDSDSYSWSNWPDGNYQTIYIHEYLVSGDTLSLYKHWSHPLSRPQNPINPWDSFNTVYLNHINLTLQNITKYDKFSDSLLRCHHSGYPHLYCSIASDIIWGKLEWIALLNDIKHDCYYPLRRQMLIMMNCILSVGTPQTWPTSKAKCEAFLFLGHWGGECVWRR